MVLECEVVFVIVQIVKFDPLLLLDFRYKFKAQFHFSFEYYTK